MFIQKAIVHNIPVRRHGRNVYFGSGTTSAANGQDYVTTMLDFQNYRNVEGYLRDIKDDKSEGQIKQAAALLAQQYGNHAFETDKFIIVDVTTTLHSPRIKTPVSATTFYLRAGKEADSWYKDNVEHRNLTSVPSQQDLIDNVWKDFHISTPGSSTPLLTRTVGNFTLDFLNKKVIINGTTMGKTLT